MRGRVGLLLLLALAVVLLIWAFGEASYNPDPWRLVRDVLRSRGIELEG